MWLQDFRVGEVASESKTWGRKHVEISLVLKLVWINVGGLLIMLKKKDNEIKGESKSTHTLVPCLMTATHASKVSVYGLFRPSMKYNKFPCHVLSTRVFCFFSYTTPPLPLFLPLFYFLPLDNVSNKSVSRGWMHISSMFSKAFMILSQKSMLFDDIHIIHDRQD